MFTRILLLLSVISIMGCQPQETKIEEENEVLEQTKKRILESIEETALDQTEMLHEKTDQFIVELRSLPRTDSDSIDVDQIETEKLKAIFEKHLHILNIHKFLLAKKGIGEKYNQSMKEVEAKFETIEKLLPEPLELERKLRQKD